MKFKQKHLALAVAAALVGAVASPMPALAFSVDAAATGPGNLATDDRGDALIYPFYTTSGELNQTLNVVTTARSTFSLTNTSPTQSLAVKIRFREQVTSQEVFDFIVFLSPEDKFDFIVKQKHDDAGAPEGPPKFLIAPNETSCVAPLEMWTNRSDPTNNPTLFDFKEPAFPIPGVETEEDLWRALAVGHLEVIAMADITNASLSGSGGSDPTPIGPWAVHDPVTLEPTNCPSLARLYEDATSLDGLLNPAGDLPGNPPADAPNALIGRMLVTVPEAGVEAGTNAIPIKNLFIEDVSSSQQPGATCQEWTDQCMSQYAWDTGTAQHPHMGDSANIANVEAALAANAVANDWSRADATQVWVDWIVGFPTKYVYTDYVNCGDGGSTDPAWCFVGNVLDPTGSWTNTTVTADEPYPLGCQKTSMTVWDYDELQNSAVSPAAFPPLCNEINVFHIRENDTSPPPSLIQYDDWRFQFVVNNLEARERGWAELEFLWGNDPTGRKDGVVGLGIDTGSTSLMAPSVVGLAFTTRATGEVNVNNASLTDLSRIRFDED